MAEGSDPQQDVTYWAPVGSVDLKASDDDGTRTRSVRATTVCRGYAEVVVVAGEVLVREWHAVGCPQFQELIRD